MSRNSGTATAFNLKTRTHEVFFHVVQPDQARNWLENHNHINRPQRYSSIEKYVRDKINGLWLTTPDTISFDWDGEIIDGQHRLEMIVQSNQSLKSIIALGFDPAVRMVVNTGIPRRPHDILKLLGFEASPWDVAIVRQMMNGVNRRATMPEICEAYKMFEKRTRIVIGMFPHKRKKITISPVLAPMARALDTYQEEGIQEFADILLEGMARRGYDGDRAVVQLRDHLLELPSIGGNADRQIYKLTETALYAFLNNEKIKELVPTKEELFPMRGEKKLLKLMDTALPEPTRLRIVPVAETATAA